MIRFRCVSHGAVLALAVGAAAIPSTAGAVEYYVLMTNWTSKTFRVYVDGRLECTLRGSPPGTYWEQLDKCRIPVPLGRHRVVVDSGDGARYEQNAIVEGGADDTRDEFTIGDAHCDILGDNQGLRCD